MLIFVGLSSLNWTCFVSVWHSFLSISETHFSGCLSLQRPLGNFLRNGRVHSDRCPVSVAQPVMELDLSKSQRNVCYIFQLFFKDVPQELAPFVSCQNDAGELLQTLGCHQPPLFICHFPPLANQCLVKRKNELRTFPSS